MLRYLLHAHSGPVAAQRAKGLADEFADSRPLQVNKSRQKHTAYEIEHLA